MNNPYVLNRQMILDRLGGDEEIFAVMVDMYLQDVESYAEKLGQTLAEEDAESLQREAHTIKGLFATFGDEAGTAAAYALEKQAKLGILDGQETPVAAIQARLFEVGEVLKTQLAASA